MSYDIKGMNTMSSFSKAAACEGAACGDRVSEAEALEAGGSGKGIHLIGVQASE